MPLFPAKDDIPVRWRRIALGVVLAMQLVFCVGLIWRMPGNIVDLPGGGGWLARTVSADVDFPRYELPAANLAKGGTLSMPLDNSKDTVVYGWVCTRHPEACLPDTTHPTTLYPPGYSIFVGIVYAIFGRSADLIVGIQIVSLLAMFALFEVMAARMLDRTGYLFVMGISATYPFLAHYAVLFSTEQLHNFLYLGALAALLLMKPGLGRGLAFGLLFSFATLVRPYSLVVFPVIWFWPAIWREAKASWRERIIAGAAFGVPLVAWAARNYYWFGKFIPLTTVSAGLVLAQTTLTWEHSTYESQAGETFYSGLAAQVGETSVTTYMASQKLMPWALHRIAENPMAMVGSVLKAIPKLWISIGTTDNGVSRTWPLLVGYLGGLLVLGVAGVVMKRKDVKWRSLIIGILVYWAFLLYTAGDARRTSGIRLPMLLLAGVAASAAWSWWQARRAKAKPAAAT